MLEAESNSCRQFGVLELLQLALGPAPAFPVLLLVAWQTGWSLRSESLLTSNRLLQLQHKLLVMSLHRHLLGMDNHLHSHLQMSLHLLKIRDLLRTGLQDGKVSGLARDLARPWQTFQTNGLGPCHQDATIRTEALPRTCPSHRL